MSNADAAKLAESLRALEGASTHVDQDLSPLVLQHVEQLQFMARALSPTAALIERVVGYAREEIQDAENSDERVVELFNEHTRRMIDDFAIRPETWSSDAAVAFKATLAVCLGVEDEMVPRAIRLFHGLPEGQRIGVYMMLEKSPCFTYLTREIDACEDDVKVWSPEKSLRLLLKSVWGGDAES